MQTINQQSIQMNLFKTALALVFFFVFQAASAQEKQWTLEDCINYALDNNIDIKKQMLMVENQRAVLLQSKLNMLPSLNAGATHGYNWGQTIDRYTNQFATSRVQTNNFYVGSQMNLFQGLQQINTINRTRLESMASQYDLDMMMDDISIAVAGFYLDILFSQELLTVSREQLSVTRQQVSRLEKMVAAGTLARGDLLSIEAQAATEELMVVEAENRLTIAYLSLQQLIDHPISAQFRIEIPVLRTMEAPQITLMPQDVFQVALIRRPEIKSAELRVQSADKGIAIARGYQSPTLSISGSWATGYSGAAKEGFDAVPRIYENAGYVQGTLEPVALVGTEFSGYSIIPWGDQLDNNQNKSLGLTLQIPIFNGWQVRTAINQARIRKEEADLSLQQTKLNLDKKIQQAYADAVAALKNYNASEKKLKAQEEAFKYAEQKLNVGMLTNVEYNDTKKELTRAESDLLQAKYRFIYTTTVLDFYMGNPLTLK
ncbi:MAG: TolC family protein [Bacteroidales bacterium]|nr:TolC family protein [Bacteroidales bacterium]